MSPGLLVLLLAGAPDTPPNASEEPRLVSPATQDVSSIDVDPREAKAQADAQAAERAVEQLKIIADPASTLTIPRGDARFVRFELPIKKRPEGPIFWRVIADRQDGAIVSPWIESVSIEEGKKKQLWARGLFTVLVDPRAAAQARVGFRVELREKETWAVLGDARVEQAISVGPAEVTESSIEDARVAHGVMITEARAALAKLPDINAYLRLDRNDGPPASTRTEAIGDLEVLLSRRIRAFIAERRLRAAADHTDQVLAEKAVLALGSLRRRPDSDSFDSGLIDKRPLLENLTLARKRLEELDLEEAEAISTRVRNRGQLSRDELASFLAILGAVHAARGLEDRAAKHFGQALCLSPELLSPSDRPPMSRIFATIAATEPCKDGLPIGQLHATKVVEARGTHLDVVMPFGPDPHELISGGEIEVYGPGGDVWLRGKSRAENDRVKVVFELNDSAAADIRSDILVRAAIKDVSGIAVTSVGTDRPIRVPVQEAETPSTVSDVPWWIWVAGGVGAVGIAVIATAALSSDGEPVRSIGPVGVTF